MKPLQFTAVCSMSPYSWDDTSPSETINTPLPETADVLIVGAGYAGLHAALQTARAGMSTEHRGINARPHRDLAPLSS